MQEYYDWDFPLPRVHTGMLLGNAVTGVMIWGEGNILRLTLGRADLWDHRGGMSWRTGHNLGNIRNLLESNDEPGLRALFAAEPAGAGQPSRPSIIPVGRLELNLPNGSQLQRGRLFLRTGAIEITYTHESRPHILRLALCYSRELLSVRLPAKQHIAVRDLPAWLTLGDTLANIGFSPAQLIDAGEFAGWQQDFPADPGLCVLHQLRPAELLVALARTPQGQAGQVHANIRALLCGANANDIERSASTWLETYWKQVPHLDLPDDNQTFLYNYGMYKFAGLSRPEGVAATLQGPWVEDYQLPPWSNDYHFNINVQMCYWPAFRGNHLEHLVPLFELIFSWEERLKENARAFAGVADGRMLPHAVDDRCTSMGGFWTGIIDHACTAWVAQMMYDYACFKPDMDFLRTRALPFMRGTFEVYAAMLEKDGGKYRLPVSVSPEYGGAQMSAWGQDASFQLAAIHRLCENLLSATDALGQAADPRWRDILNNLPPYCLTGQDGRARIALWKGQDLEESHRHHSHLAGLYPFDSIDTAEPSHAAIVENSIRHWIYKGMGLWSGWCIPWASILHGRLGNGDMAALLIDIWRKTYTNSGHGTLHDPDFPGLSLLGKPPCGVHDRPEIMQMDAGMGITAAIMENLLHERRGIHYLFRGIPQSWRNCAFRGIRARGGMLIDAALVNGQVNSVGIRACADGTIRLADPFRDKAIIRGKYRECRQEGGIITVELAAGQEIAMSPNA